MGVNRLTAMRLVRLALWLVLGLYGLRSLAGDDVKDINSVSTDQQIGILEIAESGDAMVRNRLYFRGETQLLCIEL